MAAVGAAASAITDFAWQLFENDGELACVDGLEVATAGALGAIPGEAFVKALGPLLGATAKVLPIPHVTNPKLANLVRDLYKGALTRNPIGTGSTADAVRNELKTRLPTGGTWHSDKARQYINALSNCCDEIPTRHITTGS